MALLLPSLALSALLAPHAPPRCHLCMSADESAGGMELARSFRANVATRDIGQAKFGAARVLLNEGQAAYVLLFNANQRDEGAYTLQGRRETAETYMVAFEACDDASRFAYLLQAEGFDLPQPTAWTSEQLVSFCDTAGFHLGFVPSEALLLPPRHNVFDRDAFDERGLSP